jgi:hypothetical protein
MMRGEGARGRCPFSVQLAYMLARSPFFDSILARSTTVICNFEFPDRKIGVIPSSQCALSRSAERSHIRFVEGFD